jgi:hypothetical protein
MALRYILVGLASAVTTFLLAGAVTIKTLGTRYGDSPGVGILGVTVGVVIGLLAGVVVTLIGDRLSDLSAAAPGAYGCSASHPS